MVEVLGISSQQAEELIKAHDEFARVVGILSPEIGVTLMLTTATAVASMSGMGIEHYMKLFEGVIRGFSVDANEPVADA